MFRSVKNWIVFHETEQIHKLIKRSQLNHHQGPANKLALFISKRKL